MSKVNKLFIIFLISVFSLAIVGLNSTQAASLVQEEDGFSEGENEEDEGEKTRGFYCVISEEQHPVGAALAELYGAPYEEIMDAFCAGSGFGSIGLALETAASTGETWQNLIRIREEKGWGRIWQDLELIGRPEHAGPPNDEDGDGIPDHAGPPGDNDGDGRPDFAGPPVDENGDGRPDFAGPPDDADGDGRPDHAGPPDGAGKPDDKGKDKDKHKP